MSKETILSILIENSDRFCSGEEISRQLGISRAAVGKAVAALRKEGYEIEAVTNRGYRLQRGPDRMTAAAIAPFLTNSRDDGRLIVLDEIDSTSSLLKRMAPDGAADGTVVIAEQQTAGRGRLGRSFLSPAGRGLYISFLLRPQVRPDRALNLTACTAVAVCDAIEAAVGVRPQIKWTNDILMDARKVCGILTEMSVEGESGTLQYIVVGIGINCNHTLSDFPEELHDVAGSIAMSTGVPCDRSRLAAELINAMDRMYADWLNGVWSLDRYRADCATIGREVQVLRAGKSRRAFAEEVDDDFSLVVRYEDGTRETVFSGEVSVRGLEGYA